MTDKKSVGLIVTDIDNTISDYFDNWTASWGMGIESFAKTRGLDVDTLYKDVLNNSEGNARFHNFPDLLKQVPSLSLDGKSPEERARIEREDAKTCHEVSKKYHAGNKLYDGALATIHKAKAAGAKLVLYTDSPASGAVARLADMKFPVDMLDGVVCRADETTEVVDGKNQFKKAPLQVTGANFDKYREELVSKLGDKFVINNDGDWKPNMKIFQSIMDTHGATADETIMVGDNLRSDGGAVRLGVTFAWQKEGSEVADSTQVVFGKLNDQSDYKLGSEGHLKTLEGFKTSDPELHQMYQDKMVTLEGGFKDLNKYFRFKPVEKEKANVQSQAKSADNTAVQAMVARKRQGR